MMMMMMMIMIASYTNDDGDRTRMYVRCMSKMGTNKQTNERTDGKLNSRSRMEYNLRNIFNNRISISPGKLLEKYF